MSRLILVLGDQLSMGLSALKEGKKTKDIVVMAEVREEASYVAHHPKKIAFCFAAMRKFAKALRDDNWTVRYTTYDDPDNAGSISGELLRRAEEDGLSEVVITQPGEWRLRELSDELPLTVTTLRDDRFIATQDWFEDWASDRKTLRMEYFYREMRKETGILMDGDDPVGDQWNFDHDNRKPAPDAGMPSGPKRFDPDDTVTAVLDLVEQEFPDNFGTLRPFWFATDADQAEQSLQHFIKTRLPTFGDYQDAMLEDDGFLSHAVLGLYINAGLLDPLDVCRRVEKAYRDGDAPLNAAEGFIRQIIGWREFLRCIYDREGPDYTRRNGLNHQRKLPPLFWGAETYMNCVGSVVAQTRDEAYAHHIQRLMVTGNFALLAGIDPGEVHKWYLEVYADAYEWVEAPNVIGMSQFADGGIFASKPYVSSGNYIKKMSDYCDGCAYKVTQKTGDNACPFNVLYWHFMVRHREEFSKNPRMAQMYGTWDRMKKDKRDTIMSEAEDFLDRMSDGQTV